MQNCIENIVHLKNDKHRGKKEQFFAKKFDDFEHYLKIEMLDQSQ